VDYKMDPGAVLVCSQSRKVLDALLLIGNYFARDAWLWLSTRTHTELPQALAKVLSQWDSVVTYGSAYENGKLVHASVFSGENGVASQLDGGYRRPLSDARDNRTFIVVGLPTGLEPPPGWSVETLNLYDLRDHPTWVDPGEILHLLTEFYEEYVNTHIDCRPPTARDVREYMRKYSETKVPEKVPVDVSLIHDAPRFSDMREVLYWSGMGQTLIGGIRLVAPQSEAEYYSAVNTWCTWFLPDDNELEQHMECSGILLTPNGTRIFTESRSEIECAGVTNDGKYVWWFCDKLFYIVTGDGTKLIYSGGYDDRSVMGSHEKHTGIDILGDIPEAIYRGNDGALWFEMSDCMLTKLSRNKFKSKMVTFSPWSHSQLELTLRLADSAPRDIPPPPMLSAAALKYHAEKHSILARIRCGEMPPDSGRFLIEALREKDDEMISWILREISHRRYHLNPARIEFGPEYDVLRLRMLKMLRDLDTRPRH